jgi:hypothetical protein
MRQDDPTRAVELKKHRRHPTSHGWRRREISVGSRKLYELLGREREKVAEFHARVETLPVRVRRSAALGEGTWCVHFLGLAHFFKAADETEAKRKAAAEMRIIAYAIFGAVERFIAREHATL